MDVLQVTRLIHVNGLHFAILCMQNQIKLSSLEDIQNEKYNSMY